jgi:hypothetical protein
MNALHPIALLGACGKAGRAAAGATEPKTLGSGLCHTRDKGTFCPKRLRGTHGAGSSTAGAGFPARPGISTLTCTRPVSTIRRSTVSQIAGWYGSGHHVPVWLEPPPISPFLQFIKIFFLRKLTVGPYGPAAKIRARAGSVWLHPAVLRNMGANAGNVRYHAPRGTRASPMSARHSRPLHNGVDAAPELCYGATTMQFP